jgi:FtsH-binding integral membrane protein
MSVDALRRMIDWALAAWGLQLLLSIAGVAVAADRVPATGGTATALLALRWLAGLVGLPVLLVMSRKTLDIPNTQSATGILYVACLAAILGELTSQLLHAS